MKLAISSTAIVLTLLLAMPVCSQSQTNNLPPPEAPRAWHFSDSSVVTEPQTLPDSVPPIIELPNVQPNILTESHGDPACECDDQHSMLMGRDVSPPEDESFPTFKVTGFFHLDSAWFDQDIQNTQALGDINDGTAFRRTRLGVTGNVSQDISYIVEFDIAQSQARFVDVWLQVNDTRFGNVRIGRFRQPFGMSELTSVRELPFLVRPLTFTQSPFRQTGISLSDTTFDERGTWAVAGYRFASDNFGNVFSDSGGYGLTTRITRVPIEWSENRLFHIGADYSFNNPGGGTVQLVSTNEVFVGQNPNLGPAGLSSLPIVGVPPFVNTGLVPSDNLQLFNVEGALALGRLAIQSEARWARIETAGGPSATLPGAYAQFRYTLTGETIPYNKTNGVFGRIVPRQDFGKTGSGAWELLGRISHLDLNEAGITGGRLTNYTVGCNWYWNQFTKLQFNWIRSVLNTPSIGDSDASTFAARVQLDF